MLNKGHIVPIILQWSWAAAKKDRGSFPVSCLHQAPPLLPGPARLSPAAPQLGHSAGALPPSPPVNKPSLCHVKHAAERRSVHTPTLCYCQTSAALFCCSTQSFPPVATHSSCYYSFHLPAHLPAHVRSLLDFPASHIKDGVGEGWGWGWGMGGEARGHKSQNKIRAYESL